MRFARIGTPVAVAVALFPMALEAQSELRGRLVDAAGEPVRGAIVTLVDVGFTPPQYPFANGNRGLVLIWSK